jgi:hypothetical protein
MLNVIMMSVIMINVVMLNVVMLSVIMLNVVMLNVVMSNVVMLNDAMLSVVMLGAMHPSIVCIAGRLGGMQYFPKCTSFFWLRPKVERLNIFETDTCGQCYKAF